MYEWIRLILGLCLIAAALFIFGSEIVGIFKMKYVLNRMHAAAMGDTLGILCALSGLMIISGLNFTTLKMVLVIVFLWITSPVSSHLISRMETYTNESLTHYLKKAELSELEGEAGDDKTVDGRTVDDKTVDETKDSESEPKDPEGEK
ncbi:MAG: monovalent cation/H(+) antiporter subunit G [Lachnospiraceae bacterium]|nr:monovalent cation/H(+) antiporter subunit G [Lachnospiraceae bacterium]